VNKKTKEKVEVDKSQNNLSQAGTSES